MSKEVEKFISTLANFPTQADVFNPWNDVDSESDIGPRAPQIRRRQLAHYLESRLKSAHYLSLGEAIGYQGGHFSGIAMTSERILLGFMKGQGIAPEFVLPSLAPERTSKPEIKAKGFSEPTATIVWKMIVQLQISPFEFVLWNTFAWHPYNSKKGMLSNRKPTQIELQESGFVLKEFLSLFPTATVLALGKVAFEALDQLNIPCHPIRHPAQGGAAKFRSQFKDILVNG